MIARFCLPLALACAVSLSGTAQAASDKRTPPDYDGRDEPTTPGDVLLWVPRVVLAPAYFASEYLLRRPLGWLIANAEREGIPSYLYDLFTFGPDRKAGILPTTFIDFGFDPSVGFYAFWNDAGFEGHELRLRGATWGKDWLAASFAERIHYGPDEGDRLALELGALRRPDYTFFGLGPDSRETDRHRYGMNRLSGLVRFDEALFARSSFQADIAIRSVHFWRGGHDEEPLLQDAIRGGIFPAPRGYARGYTLVQTSGWLVLDSRAERPQAASGVRLSLRGSHASELRERTSFVGYGGSLTGYWDLNDLNRVVSLSAGARFVDPLNDGGDPTPSAGIPFTELVSLGGTERMRGFVPGRLLGRSAAVLDLAYRWPIWMWLDGAMHAELGNVFGPHLREFAADRLRWSAALGIESTGSTDAGLELLLGVGSETFEVGAKPTSLRIVFGTTHGF